MPTTISNVPPGTTKLEVVSRPHTTISNSKTTTTVTTTFTRAIYQTTNKGQSPSVSLVVSRITQGGPVAAQSPSGATSPTTAGGSVISGVSAKMQSTQSTTSTTSTPTSRIASSSASPAGSHQSPASASGGGKSYSAGDIAGAAVGCLIGGALIAFIAAYFFFRRKQRRDAASRQQYGDEDHRNQRELAAVNEKTNASSNSSGMGWLAYLPQSMDDRAVQHAVKTFFGQIDLHVDNYYRRNGVGMDENTRQALARIDSGKLPGRVDDLMQDPRVVLSVIKHCIADLLITRMSPLAYPETSLLPAHVSTFPTRLQAQAASAAESNAVHQAYSQWRLLNAYLYPNPEQDHGYLEDRDGKAHDIAELLAAAFSPWQLAADDKGELHHHEKSLVATAGNLGIVLISQPSAYEFQWRTDSGKSSSQRSLVVMPGFWKTADDQGRPLAQPQNLVAPSVI